MTFTDSKITRITKGSKASTKQGSLFILSSSMDQIINNGIKTKKDKKQQRVMRIRLREKFSKNIYQLQRIQIDNTDKG
jgi:hypothetical protein